MRIRIAPVIDAKELWRLFERPISSLARSPAPAVAIASIPSMAKMASIMLLRWWMFSGAFRVSPVSHAEIRSKSRSIGMLSISSHPAPFGGWV